MKEIRPLTPLFLQPGAVSTEIVSGKGRALITEQPVFPGVWCIQMEARGHSFSYPPGFPEGVWEISHCREGRLEYQGKERYFFLGPGDLTVHRSGRDTLRCPTGRYQGLSVIIDPAAAPRCASCILEGVEVEPDALFNRLCPGGEPFIVRSDQRLAHIFSEIYAAPEPVRKGYLKVKTLELLLFLACLDPRQSDTARRSCTPAQAELVRKVLEYVRERPSDRLTEVELAAAFHVSPRQLQKSFRCIYGLPVYQCLRGFKLHLAAEALKTTGRTVMDIAGEFGYANGSKFAAAFKEVMGLSPGEYRAREAVLPEAFRLK